MRKPLTIALALLAAGCDAQPAEDEKARYIADAERRVILPNGAGKLSCYERNYAVVRKGGALFGEKILVGVYNLAVPYQGVDYSKLGRKRGVQWRDSNLTANILDQGCDTLSFRYSISSPDRIVRATCAPIIDSSVPKEVYPGVVC